MLEPASALKMTPCKQGPFEERYTMNNKWEEEKEGENDYIYMYKDVQYTQGKDR